MFLRCSSPLAIYPVPLSLFDPSLPYICSSRRLKPAATPSPQSSPRRGEDYARPSYYPLFYPLLRVLSFSSRERPAHYTEIAVNASPKLTPKLTPKFAPKFIPNLIPNFIPNFSPTPSVSVAWLSGGYRHHVLQCHLLCHLQGHLLDIIPVPFSVSIYLPAFREPTYSISPAFFKISISRFAVALEMSKRCSIIDNVINPFR